MGGSFSLHLDVSYKTSTLLLATLPTLNKEGSSNVVDVPLECSTDAFFKFFKEQVHELPKAFSIHVSKIEHADGNESGVHTVGSSKWIFLKSADGHVEKIKYRVEDIDDLSKKIKFKVLEGEVLDFYNTFAVTLEVTDGRRAKWTIEREEKREPHPNSDVHPKLLDALSHAVDAYIGTASKA